jgi:hypothetical protein
VPCARKSLVNQTISNCHQARSACLGCATTQHVRTYDCQNNAAEWWSREVDDGFVHQSQSEHRRICSSAKRIIISKVGWSVEQRKHLFRRFFSTRQHELWMMISSIEQLPSRTSWVNQVSWTWFGLGVYIVHRGDPTCSRGTRDRIKQRKFPPKWLDLIYEANFYTSNWFS